MARAFFVLYWLFVVSSAFADSDASRAFECHTPIAKANLAAKLDQVQRAYEGVGAFRARFEQDSFLAALDAQEISVGTVIFKKPGMMQWHYESPDEQTFTLRDKTVWLYQPQVRQVLIDELGSVILSELPVSFLMGLGNLTNDFDLSEGCISDSGTVIALVPRFKTGTESDRSLKSFRLLLSEKSAFPIGAKISDVAGNVTTLLFKAIVQNPTLSEKQFTAKYPAGTDINDRRRKG